jgi:hypothetical protein
MLFVGLVAAKQADALKRAQGKIGKYVSVFFTVFSFRWTFSLQKDSEQEAPPSTQPCWPKL